uniref:Uncharacterized protein n=1 Tax=Timema genevievae TaxID=629358 RepID=A0A7R9K616_TIMGE|nr:unnamed protein product [Timema genevievae]
MLPELVKKKHNSGVAYINSRGKSISEKELQPPPCGSKCKQHGFGTVSEEQRKEALRVYWNMGDVTLQHTSVSEIEDCFKRFVKRDDIDIILINQNVAEMIRHVIDSHTQPLPAILEIPSKDHPYDASKDSILRRARVIETILSSLYNCGHKWSGETGSAVLISGQYELLYKTCWDDGTDCIVHHYHIARSPARIDLCRVCSPLTTSTLLRSMLNSASIPRTFSTSSTTSTIVTTYGSCINSSTAYKNSGLPWKMK